MSVIMALCGSFGSSLPDAVPWIFWYGPTFPNDVPPNVGFWLGAVAAVVGLMVNVTMPVAGGGGGGAGGGGTIGLWVLLLEPATMMRPLSPSAATLRNAADTKFAFMFYLRHSCFTFCEPKFDAVPSAYTTRSSQLGSTPRRVTPRSPGTMVCRVL